MKNVAGALWRLSGRRLTPNQLTIIGVLMHIPIAIFIALGWWIAAAILLVIFGLFDTLDGELARLTKQVSTLGMVLDSSTDRIKETLLYSGAIWWMTGVGWKLGALLCALAAGLSICVSYVKARGEIAVATTSHKKFTHSELNKKLFPAGLMPFEIRIGLLILGLLLGQIWRPVILVIVAGLVATGSLLTFLQRLYNIAKVLK